MTLAASSLLFTLLLPGNIGDVATLEPAGAQVAAVVQTLPALSPALAADLAAPLPGAATVPTASFAPRLPWTRKGRPGALTGMYLTYGTLQALDVYSTQRALRNGAVELNPVMRPLTSSTAAMLAVKGLSTAVSIYCAEKAWKRNRKAAVVLMAAINGATAYVVSHNLRQGPGH